MNSFIVGLFYSILSLFGILDIFLIVGFYCQGLSCILITFMYCILLNKCMYLPLRIADLWIVYVCIILSLSQFGYVELPNKMQQLISQSSPIIIQPGSATLGYFTFFVLLLLVL